MNIRIESNGAAVLYVSSICGYCGRELPEQGDCRCGVWRRYKVMSPAYIIETTPQADVLIHKEGHWKEQYEQARKEQQ